LISLLDYGFWTIKARDGSHWSNIVSILITTTTTTTTTEATEAKATEAEGTADEAADSNEAATSEATAKAEAQTETPTTTSITTTPTTTKTKTTTPTTTPPTTTTTTTTFGNLNCSFLVDDGPKKIQIRCTNTLNLDNRTIDSIVGEKDTSSNINANIGLHTFVIALSDYSVTMIRETGTTLIFADNNPPNGTFIQLEKQESGKKYDFTISINNIAMEGNS
jgi:hypothetical protein